MPSQTLPPYDPARPPLQFRRTFFLHGPNIWSRNPVMEVWVDLAELKDWSSELIPGFNERYKAWLPSVFEHRCSVGEPGGFFQRLDRGTYLAHILEHTVLELQTLAGSNVGFGRAREMSEEGVYKVAVRYEEETLAKECLLTGRELLIACVYDRPFDIAKELQRLHDLADRRLLGPSSKAILAAAQSRNIPFRRLTTGSLVQLGYGKKQRRLWTAETDRTSAIAETIAQDKQFTKQLLTAAHVPVPEGRGVADAEDAWRAAEEIGGPIVVKPRDANHGRGVFPNLTERDEVLHAFGEAAKEGSGVIVERFVPGVEHRVLVVGNRVVAATRGDFVYVTGDGKRTIEQLIAEDINTDPRRGESEQCPLCLIELDPIVLMVLKTQRFTPQSVPAIGKRVLISRNDNLSVDVTDKVHPLVAHRAVLAARTVGLDVAGLDMVLEDISRPIEEQRGAIVEVNAGPGLLMHIKPSEGKPRPVGEAIIDHMFPPGEDARIPIVCVTGTNGKTTVVRMIKHLLTRAGHLVGSTDSTGQYVGDWQQVAGPCDDAPHARDVLMNVDVSAAVFEAGVRGILEDGLGFDKCSVAIVTNLDAPDHLGGEYDLWSEEKLFGVKRTPVDVVLESGAAVLNAGDKQVMQMRDFSRGDLILFARDASLSAVREHLAAGKRAVVIDDGRVMLRTGNEQRMLCSLADIAVTQNGALAFQVENVLAAVAAAWQLGLADGVVVQGLSSPEFARLVAEHFEIRSTGGRSIVRATINNQGALQAALSALNFNPAATSAAGDSLFGAIAWGIPSDRREQDLLALADAIAGQFRELHLYNASNSPQSGPSRVEFIARRLAELPTAKSVTTHDSQAAAHAAVMQCKATHIAIA